MSRNAFRIGLALVLPLAATQLAPSQSSFTNLGFESASVPNGTQPGSPTPISAAFPGWSGSFSNVNGVIPATQVVYGGLSLGGSQLSLIDANTGAPLQGSFSAYLFGGLSPGGDPTYTALSQIGTVPNNAKSLLMDVSASNGFTVTLGGQNLNVVPVQTFPSYTLYGADISAFAGQTLQLSIVAPPTSVPNGVLLDEIVLSSSLVPKPGAFALFGVGLLFLALRQWRFRT